MRVFELAKEMNLPAKQLLQRIRKLGIPVSSNFNALSDEQIAIFARRSVVLPVHRQVALLKKVQHKLSPHAAKIQIQRELSNSTVTH